MFSNKPRLLLIGFLFVGFIIISAFYLAKNSNRRGEDFSGRKIPVPTSFDQNYSRISAVVPGKDSEKDVERKQGEPESKTSAGQKKYLYYKTPSPDYKNIVMLEDDKVVYTIEEVFRERGGGYDDFKQRFGSPNLTLYGEGPVLTTTWSVFLKYGVAISHTEGYVSSILRFFPQSEKDFMRSVADDIGIGKTRPVEIIEAAPEEIIIPEL